MGWLGNILIVIGLWKLGYKHKSAFLFTAAGEAIWTGYAAYLQMWDLAAVCVVFGVLAMRNWLMWSAPDKELAA